ncbi:hypothetical protein PAXRUDRAFT_822950 [Paxillus rubicundulus Ve08.2h10]|uniref:RlpA-like protein double-psi beta-barrel domain-containing protein n=1 Tax=Paxillus rubicundulus Ve08.2h10 TaxID=930991 RepID=A0A0D0DVY7_9AGAM|nr:hypothetical protein PAXRUDRAFT_822950 [Paxillus rubicundulus Ve08.2h10]
MRIPACVPVLSFVLLVPLVGAATMDTTRTTVSPDNSHSLGTAYQFDPRDGWEPVIVTNLRYKYRSPEPNYKSPLASTNKSTNPLERPPNATKKQSEAKGVLESIGNYLAGVAGIGKSEPVTITWYTGHDLLNPSCWNQPDWTPTDKSFVAAVTQDGWTTRPKCFNFLELCKNSNNCTFVRVVDTCGGCAKGSKHVDLTQAAFERLAPLSEGVMTVQMRQATDPENWYM